MWYFVAFPQFPVQFLLRCRKWSASASTPSIASSPFQSPSSTSAAGGGEVDFLEVGGEFSGGFHGHLHSAFLGVGWGGLQ